MPAHLRPEVVQAIEEAHELADRRHLLDLAQLALAALEVRGHLTAAGP